MSSQLTSYAMKTSPGPVLNVNEDLVDINLVNNIYTIMDGFGGAGIGDAAVNFVKSKVLEFYSSACSDPDSTLPYFFDPKYNLELNVLINSIHHTHKELMKDNQLREIGLRGGMSFIFLLYVDSLLMMVSIGNCKAYVRRNSEIIQVLKPDTLECKSAKEFDAALGLFPSNAFGLYNKLDLKITEVKVHDGDQFLLCTDGVYAYQSDDEINYILSKTKLSNAEKISELLDLSNIRGNWDNQSVMLLHF